MKAETCIKNARGGMPMVARAGGEIMKKHHIWRRLFLFSMSVIALLVVMALMIPGTRARLVMASSSWQQYRQSPLKEHGIQVDLPVGEGWFEDMLFYQDSSGLKTQEGRPLELSIYYTFGDFKNGRSTVYIPGSGYYSSFYGAYLILGSTLPMPDVYWLERVSAHDYEALILKALGHPSPYGTFKVKAFEIREESELLGYPDWTRYDGLIEAPGVAHQRGEFLRHYLQFGSPPDLGSEAAFGSTTLNGRIYVKSFEAEELLVMVYLICESSDVLERTDALIRESGRLVIN